MAKRTSRIISKRGEINVAKANMTKKKRRYMQDLFTTLIDVRWRWALIVFALNFVVSWLTFGLIWYGIMSHHGDFEHDNMNNPHWEPCVTNVTDFLSCFLFSIETQQTIGYGTRRTTEQCPMAMIVMCVQCVLGVIAQAFMVGVVFAKLSKSKKRRQTLLFSKNAVVCHRDGVPCLMFRVGDMRKSHIIQANIKAQIIRNRVSREGEVLPCAQTELKVFADNGQEQGKLFFIWPMTIVHRIDETSPLFKFAAVDFATGDFEIVVILGGCVETTGVTVQARTSYLPSEILWGRRFEPVVNFSFTRGKYEVDYSVFDKTNSVTIPSCSAEELMKHKETSPFDEDRKTIKFDNPDLYSLL